MTSARTGDGLDAFRNALLEMIGGGEPQRDVPAVTNLRHADLLARGRASLQRARDAAVARAPEEFVLADLNEARAALEEITGVRTPDDLLAHIFSSFCIGK